MTMKTISRIPTHRVYRDGCEQRYRSAWENAFKACRLLKRHFGVHEIRVTGSLLHRESFHEESDIDLVVPEFGIREMLAGSRLLEHRIAFAVDIIPLKSVLEGKKQYYLERSVALGSKEKT